MAIAPDYDGGLMPQAGDVSGARFRPMDAPKANIDGIFSAYKDIAELSAKDLDEANEAIFTDAEADLHRYATNQRINKDTGYRNLHGADALRPDENGASLPDRVVKDLGDYRDSLMAGWSPKQQALFKKRTKSIFVDQYADASSHIFDENNRYAASAAANSLSSYVDAATQMPDDPIAVQLAMEKAKEYGDFTAGRAGLDKAGVERAIRESQGKVLESIVGAAIDRSADDDNYPMIAKGYLDKYAKDVDPATRARLRSISDRAITNVATNKYAQDSVERLTRPWESIKRTQALFGASVGSSSALSYTLPANATDDDALAAATAFQPFVGTVESGRRQFDQNGVPVRSPTGAVGYMQLFPAAVKDSIKHFEKREANNEDIAQVTNSEEMNKTRGTQYLALQLKDFKDARSAFAAYNVGAAYVKSAVKALGPNWYDRLDAIRAKPKDKRSTDEQKWLDGAAYANKVMAEAKNAVMPEFTRADGSKVSAMGATGEYAKRFFTDISEASIRADLMQNPELAANKAKLDEATRKAADLVRQQKQAFADDQTNTMSRLIEGFWRNGQIDQTLLNNLTPSAQLEFRDWTKRMQTDDSSGDLELHQRITLYPDEVFLNQATKEPISSAEALTLASTLGGKTEQRWGMEQYYKFKTVYDHQRGIANATKGQAPDGGYAPISDEAIIRAAASWLPETFGKKGKLDKEQQMHLAEGIRMALSESAKARLSVLKPDSQEFRDEMRRICGMEIDQQAILSFIGFGPNKVNLLAYDPDKLPHNGPTSPGMILDALTTGYNARRGITGREPSNGEKRELLVQLMLMKDPQIFPNGNSVDSVQMDSALYDSIMKDFRADFKKANGREPKYQEYPNKLQTLKEYFKRAIAGKAPPEEQEGGRPGNAGFTVGSYSSWDSVSDDAVSPNTDGVY